MKQLAILLCPLLIAVLPPPQAGALEYTATPATYKDLLAKLGPGDVLKLATGQYPRLYIANVRGRSDAWITVRGDTGATATIVGASGYNTVEIENSSHLVLANLRIDSRSISDAFGVSIKGGTANRTHDLKIEENTFVAQPANGSLQQVAISTKAPVWNMAISRNVIEPGWGLGMYLGNSDGTMPFVAGTIERNVVRNPLGYGAQVKWQLPRPAVTGMPTAPSRTVIRHNVFIKDDILTESSARPNLLVGGFPDTGPGSEDVYEIYGNFFYNNPFDALLQASGRVSIHDNIFVKPSGSNAAVVLGDHDLPLKRAHVYTNTLLVHASGTGINMRSVPREEHAITGNLIFGQSPLVGVATNVRDNLAYSTAEADQLLTQPGFTLPGIELYPLPGKLRQTPLDLTPFNADGEYDKDFNSMPKSGPFRGAYFGEGENPGWRLSATVKTARPSMPANVRVAR